MEYDKFKKDEIETITRPTYEAMENKLVDILIEEIKSLGLDDEYLKDGNHISSEHECNGGKSIDMFYLLNLNSDTVIDFQFEYSELNNEFRITKIRIGTENDKISIDNFFGDVFFIQELGFFSHLVKLWLGPDRKDKVLKEMANCDYYIMWDYTNYRYTQPPTYSPKVIEEEILIHDNNQCEDSQENLDGDEHLL